MAVAQAKTTPWPHVAEQATQTGMALATAWPSDTNMAIGFAPDPGYSCGLGSIVDHHGPQISTETLAMAGSQTQTRSFSAAQT